MKKFIITIVVIINSLLVISNCFSQWTHYTGPFGGQAYSLTSYYNYVFAGTGSGVKVSSNSGLNWTYSGAGYTSIYTMSVLDTVIFCVSSGANIYRSFNFGQTWSSCNSGINTSGTFCLSSGNNMLFAGTANTGTNNGGVYRSNNYGTNWTQSGISNLNVSSMTCCGNYAFAGTRNTGLYYSSGPNYSSWSYLGFGSDTIFTMSANNNSVFVGSNNALYRSTNGGTGSYSNVMSGNIKAVSAFADTVFAFNQNVLSTYFSTNNGTNWTIVEGLAGINIVSLKVSNNLVVAGSDVYGVFISTDRGVTWSNRGFTDVSITSFAKSTNYIFSSSVVSGLGNSGGVYRSSDNGANWISSPGIPFSAIRTIASRNNYVFFGSNYNGIYRSTNEGNNWAPSGSGSNVPWVYNIFLHDTTVFAGSESGLYRSTDNGGSWMLIKSGAAIYSGNGKNNLTFCGTGTGIIFRSTDKGNTWNQVFSSGQRITSIVFKDSVIFASTSANGLYRSTDSGLNWILKNSGLPGSDVKCLYVLQNKVFAATWGGFYYSTDNGESWIQKNDGFSDNKLESVYANDNYLFSGSASNGIYRRLISDISGIQNITKEIPSSYSLSQNYPNPFNPITNVKFSILNAGDVKIVVYDVSGREVQTLVNERLQPGTYETTFDGSQLTSGVYFCRMKTDQHSDIIKVVLIK